MAATTETGPVTGATATGPVRTEQRRARLPDVAGFVERDGVRLAYEVFGSGEPTVLLMPAWAIVPSRFWRAQVGYLARHFRVVTFDGRGCGRSDRPTGGPAYEWGEVAADTVAVLDATGTERAVLVGASAGGPWGLRVAADHPERVLGLVALGALAGIPPTSPERQRVSARFDEPGLWDEDGRAPRGWDTDNRDVWLNGGYRDFTAFLFSQAFPEAHSTKQVEDCVGWADEIPPQVLSDSRDGLAAIAPEQVRAACERVRGRVPVLVVHGDDDRLVPHANGVALAEATGGSLVTVAGGGHSPLGRDPVLVNRLVREFVDRVHPRPVRRTWTRAARRAKRALYVSSPIGLGHARRDVAIARELRRLHPDVQVDWLAQHPVTTVLADAGERVHPASAHLASESAHIESEADEHDLHAFQALRRMDETLVHNFMVFHDVVTEGHYDLVIGDEAWDVDYFLHENPELKRFAYAWMTDFVGYLPMPDGGAAEAALTADYNAEMLEQRARYRRLRDRSVFVGGPDDVVPDSFGPGLPGIRDWTQANFDFPGYVTGFDPVGEDERAALRAAAGLAPDERLCLVTVGGSGVGGALLRRVLDAAPLARRSRPDLRFLVVSGPRIDPASLPAQEGVTVRGYVPGLYRHLAACDVAVVQGGLTTCMELTANRRPFVYVPLRNHFEQNLHVRHRLERYGAGRLLPYDEAVDPDRLAEALLAEVDRDVDYRPVETDGATRAAGLLADLL